MKSAIQLFTALRERLAGFGDDTLTQGVIESACRLNGWFTPADIRRAVVAIREQMLDPQKLEAWLRPYPVPVAVPQNVLVVMAGNIPLVGFFDLLCVVASGHCCLIKPAAKDRVLMEYIVELLREIDPAVPIAFYDGVAEPGAVIATGSDNANRYFRMLYARIPALLRGNRQSVAVLSGQETAEQLAGLADDIWAYSGLGCRSVSLLFLPKGRDLQLTVPTVSAKYRNNYCQQKALLTMTGESFCDLGSAVAIEQRTFPVALSRICYSYYNTLEEVECWLAEHDGGLQCVVSECVRHSRSIGLGQAQAPRLTDYPDNLDVIAFLTSLK